MNMKARIPYEVGCGANLYVSVFYSHERMYINLIYIIKAIMPVLGQHT